MYQRILLEILTSDNSESQSVDTFIETYDSSYSIIRKTVSLQSPLTQE